jgi:hypothetical protein
MRRILSNGISMAAAVALLAGAAGAAGPPGGPLSRCPADAVVSGAGCMDKYEASVWRVPNPTTVDEDLVGRTRRGTAPARSRNASVVSPCRSSRMRGKAIRAWRTTRGPFPGRCS